MTSQERMVESHVLEYTARLKHIDELIERASRAKILPTKHESELADIKKQRKKLIGQLDKIKHLSAAEWSRAAGPMVIWDIVAERLEHLLEGAE